MQITARGEYAVRAVLAAAANPANAPVTATAVAVTHRIPLGFLYRILSDLRLAGLIVTHRGSNGGYRLARPATAITIGDVLRSVDDGQQGIGAARGLPRQYGPDAGVDRVWAAVRAAITEIVDHTTIAEVISDSGSTSDEPPSLIT